MKTAIVIPQRSVEYNVFVGTPEVLFEFYTEVNKLTGLPRYRHMGKERMIHIFNEIADRSKKVIVCNSAKMIAADLNGEKRTLH